MQAYRTVKSDAVVEFTINKSRFIGRCFKVETEEDALKRLEQVRKNHRDATHNCYAYSIGPQGGAARFSDDGEPGGTAGQPMMETLRHKNVTNIICVATRYFGGVLLGAGGLVRAYSRAAADAIEAAQPVWMRPCTLFELNCDYSRWGMLEPLLREQGELQNVSYTDTVSVQIAVLQDRANAFEALVVDRTDGKVMPVSAGFQYGEFP
ncbi:YigZ family protein [Eubacteriales bacterium OttesenSCG-928-K08]|nr:YigZ family protein [Eubacteriales bacterium OttesenSCG-928-K08]